MSIWTFYLYAPWQRRKVAQAIVGFILFLAIVFLVLGEAIDPAMISLQIFYEGSVQGVGFRWSVRHIAKGFDVTGWVRNLPDGRVEMQIAGEDSEVMAFLDAIKTSELASHIRRQQEARLQSPPNAHGFEIRQ